MNSFAPHRQGGESFFSSLSREEQIDNKRIGSSKTIIGKTASASQRMRDSMNGKSTVTEVKKTESVRRRVMSSINAYYVFKVSRAVKYLLNLYFQISQHETKPVGKPSSRYYSVLQEEETLVERNASVLLPVLEDIEKEFHDLVAVGDVAAVRVFLHNHPDFNINCVNYQVRFILKILIGVYSPSLSVFSKNRFCFFRKSLHCTWL